MDHDPRAPHYWSSVSFPQLGTLGIIRVKYTSTTTTSRLTHVAPRRAQPLGDVAGTIGAPCGRGTTS